MADGDLKAIDVADQMIGRIQNLCQRLRLEGFPCVANELEDDFIELYDRLLSVLARNDYSDSALDDIAVRMSESLNKVEKVTELVDFRDRIMKVFNREGRTW